MPQLVQTPEQVLRKTKRDLYLIRFKKCNFSDPDEIPGRREVERWFAKHLPATELEILGPSEGSGFISGGIGRLLRVDFTPQALEYFIGVWENPDGSYKDERWDCVCMPYADV